MVTNNEQTWLFRQGDLVLGPVPSEQIVDKLYSGELSGASEVRSIAMQQFVPLNQLPDFTVHIAKAEVQRRVTADHNAFEVARRLRRNRTLAVATVLLVVIGVGVAALGSYLAVHGSLQTVEEVAWGDISMGELTITRAKRARDEELFDYQGPAGKRPDNGTSAGTGSSSGTGRQVARNPSGAAPPPVAAPPKVPGKPKPGTADPDGLQMGDVDQEGINAVIAQKRPTLLPCLKEVAKPGMVAKIPIEFSIAEGGRVAKVWVDNPDFKGGPLSACLLRELQKWPFKQSQAGATVQLSFNIGKK